VVEHSQRGTERPSSAHFSTKEHVRGDVEVRSQGECLVDGLDPRGLGILRSAEMNFAAVDGDGSNIRDLRACEALDQGGLSSSVVPDDGEMIWVDEGVDRDPSGLRRREAERPGA
jgi:hypothetical protein